MCHGAPQDVGYARPSEDRTKLAKRPLRGFPSLCGVYLDARGKLSGPLLRGIMGLVYVWLLSGLTLSTEHPSRGQVFLRIHVRVAFLIWCIRPLHASTPTPPRAAFTGLPKPQRAWVEGR